MSLSDLLPKITDRLNEAQHEVEVGLKKIANIEDLIHKINGNCTNAQNDMEIGLKMIDNGSTGELYYEATVEDEKVADIKGRVNYIGNKIEVYWKSEEHNVFPFFILGIMLIVFISLIYSYKKKCKKQDISMIENVNFQPEGNTDLTNQIPRQNDVAIYDPANTTQNDCSDQKQSDVTINNDDAICNPSDQKQNDVTIYDLSNIKQNIVAVYNVSSHQQNHVAVYDLSSHKQNDVAIYDPSNSKQNDIAVYDLSSHKQNYVAVDDPSSHTQNDFPVYDNSNFKKNDISVNNQTNFKQNDNREFCDARSGCSKEESMLSVPSALMESEPILSNSEIMPKPDKRGKGKKKDWSKYHDCTFDRITRRYCYCFNDKYQRPLDCCMGSKS